VTSVSTLLVANRGEIARRVLRTAHEMGLRTVAVFSEPDRDAPHTREADVAVALGGETATDSYLDLDRVLAAARATGADAVHPGYGFLAENAEAARRCVEAGLVWVGPHPEAVRRMGDKLSAKQVAGEAGLPLLPSAELAGEAAFEWRRQAAAVGYPLLVKAAAGGGGKGMRLVEDEGDLADAVVTARREAQASFGDATVFAERWITGPRHIEIQVLADRHGHVLHLAERECSIQRRHQKIVEEAPSPAVDPSLRARMGLAAVHLAQAIGYDSVGTVEFLLDDATGDWFFLEMNTRLQVEHPVTEAVTGLDLVRLQIESAAGAPLTLAQSDVDLVGHAVEVRLYAERPALGWLPSTGRLHRFEHGADPGVRWDQGVETGSEITPFYDPLLAKVIAHAPTRSEALGRLARALDGLAVHGVETNRDLLVALLADRDLVDGRTTTDYLDRRPELLDAAPGPTTRHLHAVAALLVGRHHRRLADPHWSFAPGGWRVLPGEVPTITFLDGTDVDGAGQFTLAYDVRADDTFTIAVLIGAGRDPGAERIDLDDDRTTLEGRILDVGPDHVRLEIGGLALGCRVSTVGDTTWVNSPVGQTTLVEAPRFPDSAHTATAGGPTAPVPGRVVTVEVSAGDAVAAGATLVVLEAMKVEHRITASAAGVVAEVLVAPGDNVDAHQLLVRLEEAP